MYSLQLAGKVYFKTSKSVRVWFEYGPNPNSLYYRSYTEVLDREGSSRDFDIRITGLNHHTTYYYRAVGSNEKGVVRYGAIQSVTTDVDPKVDNAMVRVSTTQASGVTDDRAFMRGSIALRKSPFATVWFEYGRDKHELSYRTSKKYVTTEDGKNFFELVPNLRDGTVYYYRAVSEDPLGKRSYGATYSFITRIDVKDERPTIVVEAPKNIGGFEATVTALLDMNDFEDGIAFMVYGEDATAVGTIAQKYATYKSIREDGDRLQKVLVDNSLDGVFYANQKILYLDPNTVHYVTFGLQYENAEGQDVLLMGKVQRFTTKNAL